MGVDGFRLRCQRPRGADVTHDSHPVRAHTGRPRCPGEHRDVVPDGRPGGRRGRRTGPLDAPHRRGVVSVACRVFSAAAEPGAQLRAATRCRPPAPRRRPGSPAGGRSRGCRAGRASLTARFGDRAEDGRAPRPLPASSGPSAPRRDHRRREEAFGGPHGPHGVPGTESTATTCRRPPQERAPRGARRPPMPSVSSGQVRDGTAPRTRGAS